MDASTLNEVRRQKANANGRQRSAVPFRSVLSLHSVLMFGSAPRVWSSTCSFESSLDCLSFPSFFSSGVFHTFYLLNIGNSQILHRREFPWFHYKHDCSLILEFRVSGF